MSTFKIFFIVSMQLLLIDVSKGWLFSDDNCYPDIGCFPTSGHFSMRFPPQSPSAVGVRFVYKSTYGETMFGVEDTHMRMRNVYNPALKTVLIIHGYLESYDTSWIFSMVDALKMRRPPVNIFVVDWRRGAMNFNYLQAVANARVSGAITALFIQKLIQLGASASNVHIVGFSLGAQVAGYAGERVDGLGRITGLDPAGPSFVNTHRTVRLDPTDAVVVDVIHTDKDMGTMMPLGLIDFYPNGGFDQPMCAVGAMGRISDFLSGLDFSRRSMTRTVGCSHIRATELFTSSINNDCTYSLTRSRNVRNMRNSIGSPCTGRRCPKFGYHLEYFQRPRPGIYRFTTGGAHPYC